MEDAKFREKISLISDPYFDREFFTNLIYCMDRDKTPRDVFEAVMQEVSISPEFTPDFDRSILNLFYSYQASSSVKANYQWLPLSQGIYAMALFRGDGQNMVSAGRWEKTEPQGCSAEEFEALIRPASRAVESKKAAWASFLFLIENRSSRAQAIASFLKTVINEASPLTTNMVVQSLGVALASGWRANEEILKRAFDRFWEKEICSEAVIHGRRLVDSSSIDLKLISEAGRRQAAWKEEWVEDLWSRLAGQSSEAAWELIEQMIKEGAHLEQIFAVLTMLRGRCLCAMKTEQWAKVTSSILYGNSLSSASRWLTQEDAKEKLHLLASNLCDLSVIAQLVGPKFPDRATGESILDGASKNISKDRLVLRLDETIECGIRGESQELLAVILNDRGLSHSVGDRIMLMASKQDAWTYNHRTIPVTYTLTQAFEACRRLKAEGPFLHDGLAGLLRFLCDQREGAIEQVKETGTYGNAVSLSQYDVSDGARIVDRFVFNQFRNAQRVKIWPSDDSAL
jgi:hypothetical protein